MCRMPAVKSPIMNNQNKIPTGKIAAQLIIVITAIMLAALAIRMISHLPEVSFDSNPRQVMGTFARVIVVAANEQGLDIYRTFVGEYATSMEMAGGSITLVKLDEELISLLDAPAYSPFLPQWPKS